MEKHLNKYKSYKHNKYLMNKPKHRNKTNKIKGFKKVNYFYDKLFKYCVRLNYINNIQKHNKLLRIDYNKNSNNNYKQFFNIRKII